MTLHIAPQLRLIDIQAAFHEKFPFLKLGFFSKPHQVGESSPATFLLSERGLTVQDVNPKVKEDKTLVFDEASKVQEIEKAFFEKFGLSVQVFRKSGSVWLETSTTDHLSLAEQTEKAKDFEWRETPFADPMDYREKD